KFKSREGQKEIAKIKYLLPEVCSPILGCIGTIERRKGQDVLIDVIDNLMNTFPNLLLIIVGEIPEGDDGSYKKVLKRKIKKSKLKDKVIFFPFTSEPKFIFERIDILILPSLFKEGLPNVLIESLAMGKPVIASNLGGIPEIVKESKTGFLTKPGNVDELVNRIKFLWKNQDAYTNMAKTGRRLTENSFSRKKQFEKYLDYFNEILIEK
ncbi:MAG: glycosyltransferase family 4 protein, partial [Candidatus Hodarchaeales archaeon]